MGTFDESQHPRNADGTFGEKTQASAGISLTSMTVVDQARNGQRHMNVFLSTRDPADYDRAVCALAGQAFDDEPVLDQPLPVDRAMALALKQQDGESTYVSAVVRVDAGELVDAIRDDTVDDMLARKLVRDAPAYDMDYRILGVGASGQTLVEASMDVGAFVNDFGFTVPA